MDWDYHEDSVLSDFIFSTNYGICDIADKMDREQNEVRMRIKDLGLDWVRTMKASGSRGQVALTRIMQKLLPGEEVINEFHVGKQLRLDVYCPRFKLAAEYHGRQHYEFVEFFHGNKQGFLDASDRDQLKRELCQEQGITLVSFRYSDSLTEEVVFERLLDALRSSPVLEELPKEERRSLKDNEYYQAAKQRQREWRAKQYREMKEQRKRR